MTQGGITLSVRDLSVEDRFWLKVERGPEDKCWEWQGARSHGYGEITLNGKKCKAHRVAYELMVGPIPEGLVLDHLCRNHPCVNPSHLEAVTHLENVRRGDSGKKDRIKTHCPQGHRYWGKNLIRYQGRRYCRVCLYHRQGIEVTWEV